MKNKIDILYLIFDNAALVENNGVLQSQVIDQMVTLHQIGYSVHLLSNYQNLGNFNKNAGDILRKNNITFTLVEGKGFFFNLINYTRLLFQIDRVSEIKSIYIRSFLGALPIFILGFIKKLPFVYDVRGDLVDEALERGRSKIRVYILAGVEKFVLKRASRTLTVTTHLANKINSRAKLNAKPYVIPSCMRREYLKKYSSIREKVRSSCGFGSDDVVFVYSGGISRYQMIDQTLKLWKEILSLHTNVKFVLLLANSSIDELIHSYDLEIFGDRLVCRSLGREEVYEMLSGCDIGFLLREERPLNAVASPVKFAEYVGAGLAVVTSPNIGDISNIVINKNIGLVMGNKSCSSELSGFLKAFHSSESKMRKRIYEVAENNYIWEAYAELFIKIYGKPRFKASLSLPAMESEAKAGSPR